MAKKAAKKKAKAKWKPAKGVTWRSKLEREHPSHGKLERVPEPWRKRMGDGSMLIPRPIDVHEQMRTAKRGTTLTIGEIRARLAKAAGADVACPLTTGIFIRIAAEAAEEDRRAGKSRITPWWRTVRDDGGLFEKAPGGAAAQARHLRREGVRLERRGKSLRVARA